MWIWCGYCFTGVLLNIEMIIAKRDDATDKDGNSRMLSKWSIIAENYSSPSTLAISLQPSMKSLAATIVALAAALAVARDVDLDARQAASSGSATTPSSASTSPTSISGGTAISTAVSTATAVTSAAGASSSLGTGSSIATTSTVATTSISVSLKSENPTAIPLASIIAGQFTTATVTLAETPIAGAQPSISGAPPLPNLDGFAPSKYPALDIKAPTDSDQVNQWKQEVADSGVDIPDIAPTVLGGCPANAQAATDSSRCWWTCGGCTRDSDITTCPDKNTWGLTYDDGPSLQTPQLLDYLEEQDLQATFFVVGSRVVSFPHILQQEYMSGHQIAVHTWSHPSLTTLTNDEIIAELGWSRQAIQDVLGVTPSTMRPPYGDIDDRVRAISVAMGMTPVMWTRISSTQTFDTDDFNIQNGLTSAGQVLQNWEYILGNASKIDTGFIVLEHDLYQQSVEIATGYILPDAIAQNYTIVPVVTCLNKPMEDAYVSTNDNSTNPPAESGSAVTLSSGAPGSVQATGEAGGGGNSTGQSNSAYTNHVGTILSILSCIGPLVFFL